MKKNYIYILLTGLICSTSFIIGLNMRSKQIVPQNEPTIIRKVLPDKIVTDYQLQQLNANFTGKIVAVAADHVTIETQNGTRFDGYNEPQGITNVVSVGSGQPMKFGDIKIGNTIVGGMNVILSKESTVGTTGQRKVGDVILHYIQIGQK
ncbi:MAG: hypothetical protein ACHQT7_00120 [Candidatus Levyibacteriota bacterium]